MTTLRLTTLRIGPLALFFAAMAILLVGCEGIPQDGRYQDHDGGRSNTRAELAHAWAVTRLS